MQGAATGASGEAAGATCPRCSAPLGSPVACAQCGALLTVPAGSDHFVLLGVPRQFAIDPAQLERTYLKVSRLVHPDFFGDQSKDVQAQAMRHSALLNDAYQTLKNDVRRGEYLLRLLGGKTAAADRSTKASFLAEMLELREEADDPALPADRKEAILTDVGRRIGMLLSELPPLFEEALAIPAPAQRTSVLAALRSSLNSYYYLETLRENLSGEKRLRR